MTNHVTALTRGFTILQRYDRSGHIGVGWDHGIYCGPGDLEHDDYTAVDRTALQDEGWEFDAGIGRWGYHP